MFAPPRGSGGMRASRPTIARVVAARSGLAGHFGRFVGAGFIPPGVFAVPRGVRDDASIVPYMGFRCDKVAVSRLVVYPTIDRRGGFHIRPERALWTARFFPVDRRIFPVL